MSEKRYQTVGSKNMDTRAGEYLLATLLRFAPVLTSQ